jgi:Ca2+-binding EF-hand superfamily protein
MQEYPKRIKKLIREYGDKAYEAELSQELKKLFYRFDEWNNGKISSSELSEIIYKFTKGPAKKIYNKYDNTLLDMAVAHAIRTGVLKKEEVPLELMDHLAPILQFYEEETK